MPKKPALTVVQPAAIGTEPPRKLGKPGTDLWHAINAGFCIDDAGGIETLLQICSAADRVEALAERIRKDGEVIYVKGVPRAHPALKEETALRSFIGRGLARLGVTVETLKPVGRPGHALGWTGHAD